MPDLNDVVWFIGATSLMVCLAVAAWALILVVAGWAASVGFLRGATEVPCFYRQENFRQRIGDGSEKTFAREHPVDSFVGLCDRWSGRWFFGLMRLGDPVRLPGAIVCDLCDGTGRNTNDQLWPAHALCRACGGSGVAPPVTHTWDGEKIPLIPRHTNAGRYLAEINDGTLAYLSHANEWQGCPNFILADRSRTADLEAALRKFADFKNCTAEDVRAARVLLGMKADDSLDSDTSIHLSVRSTFRRCTCASPSIRCDDKGCNCTICGQPG